MALFLHSLVESHSDQMYYFYCFVKIFIIAGFEDDDFSLSGLTQQGHKLDVTVISSSDEDDNYGGLLECARKLGGELSEKTSSLEGGVQPGIEPGVEPNASSLPISKITNTVPITSNSMASFCITIRRIDSCKFYPF